MHSNRSFSKAITFTVMKHRLLCRSMVSNTCGFIIHLVVMKAIPCTCMNTREREVPSIRQPSSHPAFVWQECDMTHNHQLPRYRCSLSGNCLELRSAGFIALKTS